MYPLQLYKKRFFVYNEKRWSSGRLSSAKMRDADNDSIFFVKKQLSVWTIKLRKQYNSWWI